MIGKVFAVNKEKGFGFISSEELPFTRIFFYWTYLHSSLQFADIHKGMLVEFEAKKNEDPDSEHFGEMSAIKIREYKEDDKVITEAHTKELNTNE